MGQILPRQRQDYARHSRRATAIASSGRESREAIRDQREDRSEVAAPAVGGRHADGPQGAPQHFAEANPVQSVGSVGDSYENALAETVNGFYKVEVSYYAANENLNIVA